MTVDRAELLGGDIPLRPLGVAEMLDASIAGMRYSPRAVLGPSVLIVGATQFLVTLAGYFLIGRESADEVTPNIVLQSLGSQLVLAGLSLLATAYSILLLAGLIAPVLARSFFGLPVSLRQAWLDLRPQLFRLVAVATLVLGGSLLAGLLPILPFVIVAGLDGSPGLGIVLGVVGFPTGAALMSWIYVVGVLAVPAVVMERLSVGAALTQSRRLVRRQWWRTALVLVLTVIILIFMGFIALRLPFAIAGLILFGTDPSGWAEVGALAVDTLGRIVSWTITVPFYAGVTALIYFDRRMRREGLDLDLQTRRELPEDFLSLWAPSPYQVGAWTRPAQQGYWTGK